MGVVFDPSGPARSAALVSAAVPTPEEPSLTSAMLVLLSTEEHSFDIDLHRDKWVWIGLRAELLVLFNPIVAGIQMASMNCALRIQRTLNCHCLTNNAGPLRTHWH
jgi:hypothetical protein